jgi:hypothetical protein
LDYECIVLSNVGCGADKTCFHELPLISESMAMHSLKLHYFMLLCNGGIQNGFNIYFLKEHFIFSGFLNEDDKNISSHMSYITLMIVHKELYHM